MFSFEKIENFQTVSFAFWVVSNGFVMPYGPRKRAGTSAVDAASVSDSRETIRGAPEIIWEIFIFS